jgi:hypothetical protein
MQPFSHRGCRFGKPMIQNGHMKRLFNWVFFGFLALFTCCVAGIFLLDPIAKYIVESQIRANTHMDVKIEKLSIGLLSPTLKVENFILYNTAEFGGSPFVQVPELYIEYDRAAIRNRKLHIKLLRLNLEEIAILKDKKGQYNFGSLQKDAKTAKNTPKNASQGMEFVGIDTLNLTLQSARLGTVDMPANDQQVNFGIKNQIFHNVKSSKDMAAIAFILAGKSGLPALNLPIP